MEEHDQKHLPALAHPRPVLALVAARLSIEPRTRVLAGPEPLEQTLLEFEDIGTRRRPEAFGAGGMAEVDDDTVECVCLDAFSDGRRRLRGMSRHQALSC